MEIDAAMASLQKQKIREAEQKAKA